MQYLPRRWPDLSFADLAAAVPEPVLARGRECLRRGRVAARLRTEEALAGSVLGSAGWYTATARLAEGRLEAECTCPYQGAVCKHAAALLLAWLEEPATFLDLEAAPSLRDATPEDLRRFCLSLCLAAPQKAIRLLVASPPGEEEPGAAAALARSFWLAPRALRDPEGLAERLSWVAERLSAAIGQGDPEAAAAACDLAERLLAAWMEASSPEQIGPSIGRYLRRLASAAPAGGLGEAIRPRLLGLFRRESLPFLGELGLVFLAWCGGPPREGELSGTPAEVVALLAAGPEPGLVKSVGFEGLLLTLDAHWRWGGRSAAIALARAGLRRSDEGERYVLRQRLAGYHLEFGERRQALAYLLANFRLRPDVEAWRLLRDTAMAAEEWPRIRREVWPIVMADGLELQIAAALDEADPELLSSVARAVGEDHPRAAAVWSGLAAFAPEEALDRLIGAARSHLTRGGHRSRRLAAEFLRAAGRVCRAKGWEQRWEGIRAELREEFGPAVRRPELGSLLGQDVD